MTKRKEQGQYKLAPNQVLLGIHLRELGMKPIFELHVPQDSGWRFDVACHFERILFEISGGNWSGGHRRGAKQEDEYNKINTAQMLDWKVMQFTNRQVESGEAQAYVKEWLAR